MIIEGETVVFEGVYLYDEEIRRQEIQRTGKSDRFNVENGIRDSYYRCYLFFSDGPPT